MTKKKRQQSKILNFDFKNLGNIIDDYPFVEIEWLDIEVMLAGLQQKICTRNNYLYVYRKGICLAKKTELQEFLVITSRQKISLHLTILVIQLLFQQQ